MLVLRVDTADVEASSQDGRKKGVVEVRDGPRARGDEWTRPDARVTGTTSDYPGYPASPSLLPPAGLSASWQPRASTSDKA